MKPTLILRAPELRKHATKIADRIARANPGGCCVIKNARVSNPTLVAHGLVKASRWHILTHDTPRKAVADLYAGSHAEAARVTRLLANMLSTHGHAVTLDLLDNRATPAQLSAHPKSTITAAILHKNPLDRSHLQGLNTREQALYAERGLRSVGIGTCGVEQRGKRWHVLIDRGAPLGPKLRSRVNPSRSKAARRGRAAKRRAYGSSRKMRAADARARAIRAGGTGKSELARFGRLVEESARRGRLRRVAFRMGRAPNPKGRIHPTTVREAIAAVIDSAKFPVVAAEVRSGKQDPVKSLEFVRRFMSTERQRAIIDQALRLARKFPGRLLDSPAGRAPNPKGRITARGGSNARTHLRRRHTARRPDHRTASRGRAVGAAGRRGARVVAAHSKVARANPKGRKRNPIDDDPRQFSVGDVVSISAMPYFGKHGTVTAIGKKLVTVNVHFVGKRKFRAGDLRLANPKRRNPGRFKPGAFDAGTDTPTFILNTGWIVVAWPDQRGPKQYLGRSQAEKALAKLPDRHLFQVARSAAGRAYYIVVPSSIGRGLSGPKRNPKGRNPRTPQGGVYAIVDHGGLAGRAWIESVNTHKGTALVRFDPGEGMRSRARSVPIGAVHWGGSVGATSKVWPTRNPKGRINARRKAVNRRKGGARRVTGPSSRPRARASHSTPRRHPNPASKESAAKLVRMFEDRGPIKVKTRRVKAPAALKGAVSKIGDVVAVTYRSNKFDGKTKDYEHEFKSPKPVLVADPSSGDLNLVRGKSRYGLTPDGIIN